MKKVKFLFFLVCFLVFANCKEEEPEAMDNELESAQNQNISKNEIENLEFADYGLSSESTQAVEDWLKYIELNENISRLKNGDLSFIEGDQQLLITFLSDLRNTLPKSVNTLAIKSRLLVLETKILNAHNLLKLRNIPRERKLEGIKEVLIAMSNFNDQMNKKFEIESNNISRPQPRTDN